MTDVMAVGAHPDDLEVAMGGTAARLVARGKEVHFVDLTAGEPARHAPPGEAASGSRRAPRRPARPVRMTDWTAPVPVVIGWASPPHDTEGDDDG